MKKILLLILLFPYWIACPLKAQISHGGIPLFLASPEQSALKSSFSSNESLYIEMPSFNVQEMLEEDSLNESGIRTSFRFAKKFFTNIEKGKSGQNFTLADGTKVWQVGIRSKGAYSINVLFSEFYIPEGARLFLYSANKSHIIGSFTSENNSEDRLLPTAPVGGDEIIVEYSEPADVAFEGILKITEVNHDYRGILRREPDNNNSASYNCMPDILCSDEKDSDEKNSAVLLIINGNIRCSGSLINNTSNDGAPYLLTGMHCFNSDPPVHHPMQDYINLAGTIIAFFNYNRPVCGTTMRGVEEMSVAGAQARCIIEPLDIALLELNDTVPDYYQPYFAGWNIDPAVGTAKPFSNIHHPMGDLKKYGKSNTNISLVTITGYSFFKPNSFWKVSGWTIGSTDFGSSGSPLFDNENLIIGALTGGNSTCSGSNPGGQSDFFSALHLGWEYDADSLQLKKWLDPANTGVKKCPGFNPNEVKPFIRLANANYSNGDKLTTTKTPSETYLFGSYENGTAEYAEAFENAEEAILHGIYLLNPAMTYPTGINIHLYSSVNDKPGEKIASAYFSPQYTNYTSANGSFNKVNKTMSSQPSESFVRFTDHPQIKGKFFIGYEIPQNNPFLVYNTIFGTEKNNTAWMKNPVNGWIPASDYSSQPVTTALAIQPLLKNMDNDSALVSPGNPSSCLYYDRGQQAIHVNCETGATGFLSIYSITGQLISRFVYSGPGTFYLSPGYKNTMGIIHLKSEKKSEMLKTIF